MHTPTSLSKTLRLNKTLHGRPPPQTISSGLAALPASTMLELNLHATDPVLLQHNDKVCIATSWPLAAIPSQTIALDDTTLTTLSLPLTLPAASTTRTLSKNKKSTRRRTSIPPSVSLFRVQLSRIPPEAVPPAETIQFQSSTNLALLHDPVYQTHLTSLLHNRILTPNMRIPITVLGTSTILTVRTIHPTPYARKTPKTHISLHLPVPPSPNPIPIAGLSPQTALLLSHIRPHLSPSPPILRPVRAVLLHGPPGTGKTLLAVTLATNLHANLELLCAPAVLATASESAVHEIHNIFSRARRLAPSVLVLDEVDILAPCRESPQTSLAQRRATAALLALMDGPADHRDGVFVVGTTSRPDAIDPAMRRAGRFDREIEIPVPGPVERAQILVAVSAEARPKGLVAVTEEEMGNVANIAYGFVGADLAALWRESVAAALRRGPAVPVVYDDMRHALRKVRPSALREVAVEVPRTQWADVGGKADAKRRLREAVEWPLTKEGATLFRSIGVAPPNGILLFGPPGCSKTLLARAVATESGANFIAVKGAELLSKWVGESEKAVRAIFRRARLAAPCVVFFDEVDALAGSRSGMGGASAQARVVAQLLAEMDGIDSRLDEPGRRVVVIAATNRPDCLDEAFLRPGRIDAQIYVGLPDAEERLAILNVHARAVPLADDVDLEHIATDAITKGFSGAEVAALVREAALAAMEKDVEHAKEVCKADFEQALRRVMPRTPAEVVRYFEEYVRCLKVGSSMINLRL